MYSSSINKIENFIGQQLGETKYLSEWCNEINREVMSKGRRLTNRELAFIFNRFMRDRFNVDYNQSPIQYTFMEKV